jgi:hypothetical protein
MNLTLRDVDSNTNINQNVAVMSDGDHALAVYTPATDVPNGIERVTVPQTRGNGELAAPGQAWLGPGYVGNVNAYNTSGTDLVVTLFDATDATDATRRFFTLVVPAGQYRNEWCGLYCATGCFVQMAGGTTPRVVVGKVSG